MLVIFRRAAAELLAALFAKAWLLSSFQSGCRLLHCGDGGWQREYRKLHCDILAGRAQPRHLLAIGENGAHSFHLTASLTVILTASLTVY